MTTSELRQGSSWPARVIGLALVTATIYAGGVASAADHETSTEASPPEAGASPTTTGPNTTTTTSTTSTTSSTSSTTTTTTTTVPQSAPAVTQAPTTISTRNTTTTTPPPAPAPAPAPAQQNITVYPSQIAHILATIRYMESRGNYSIEPNRGNASGAYQFIASTWDNHGGYEHSNLAPPEVQDERAAIDVTRFLNQWNNDVSMIPVMWYYPRAARDLTLMDIVPVPSAGNVLTVREYQQRWLGVWAFISGRPVPQTVSLADAISRLGIPPEPNATTSEEELANIAFPVLGPSRVAAPECGDASPTEPSSADAVPSDLVAAGLCTPTAPGIVFGVKLQPVLAVIDGVVTDVQDRPGIPISVTITDETGRSYTLAGFNDDNPGTNDGAAPGHLRLSALARVGETVRAGQLLGFMGDTDELPLGVRADVPTDATVVIADDAIAPHIRLTIFDLDGDPIDAYGPVIDALFRQVCTVGTGPWSSPPNGDNHYPITIETTDNSRQIDSEWIITSEGQVTASGWAAMIYPGKGCSYTPPKARGPGAGGTSDVPDSWDVPIDLPTSVWIDLALQDSDPAAGPILRR
jgi:hypothetical protein